MDAKRIESYKQFAQYLEYPMVVFEAESGHVLEINYEAEVLLGSPVENIQIEPGRAFTKLNFWELLHGKKSLMWHRIRMVADGREFLVSGLVNEAVVEDKMIYTLLFERRADLNIGSLTLERIVDHAGLVAIHLSRIENGYQVEYVSRNVNQYGYTRAQFYEKLLSVADILCAEDREAVHAVIAKDTMAHVGENSLECRLLTEERELIPVRLLIHYIYNDYGESTDYEILMMDLREEYRKSSENRYLSLAVSKMKNVVLVKSYKGDRRTLKYISPNAGMVGMNVEALQNGYKLTEDYIYPEDRDGVIDAIYQAIDSGMMDYVHQYRMVRDDGKRIWVENVVTVTRISDGEAEISFLLTDITEQKEMEEELAETMRISEASKETERAHGTDVADIDTSGKELSEQFELMAEALSRNADYYTVVLDANGKIMTNPAGPASDLGQFYDIFERPSFKERFHTLSGQAKEEMLPQSIGFDMDSFAVHMVLAPLISAANIVAYWVLASFAENGKEVVEAVADQQWKLANSIVRGFFVDEEIRRESHHGRLLEMQLHKEQEERVAVEDIVSALTREGESALGEMCQKAGLYLSLENIGLYIENKEMEKVETYFVWNPAGDHTELLHELAVSAAEYQEICKQFRDKPVIAVDKRSDESTIKKRLRQAEMSAIMLVQLPFTGKLQGYMVFIDDTHGREFDKRDVHFAQTAAKLFAGVIQNSSRRQKADVLHEGFLDTYNHIRDAVFVKNSRSGEIVFANKSMDKLFGYSLVGMQAGDVVVDQMEQYRNVQGIRKRLIAGRRVTKWQSYLKELDQIMNIVEVNLDTINGTDYSLVILKKNKNKDKAKDKI